jgi:hypothetical protein
MNPELFRQGMIDEVAEKLEFSAAAPEGATDNAAARYA